VFFHGQRTSKVAKTFHGHSGNPAIWDSRIARVTQAKISLQTPGFAVLLLIVRDHCEYIFMLTEMMESAKGT